MATLPYSPSSYGQNKTGLPTKPHSGPADNVENNSAQVLSMPSFDPLNSQAAALYNQEVLREAKATGKQVIYKLHKAHGVVEVSIAKHRSPVRWLINTFGRKAEKKLLQESIARVDPPTPLHQRLIDIPSTDGPIASIPSEAPAEPSAEREIMDRDDGRENPTEALFPHILWSPEKEVEDEDDSFFDARDHTLDDSSASLIHHEHLLTPMEFDQMLLSVLKSPLTEKGQLVASSLGLDESQLPQWQASAPVNTMGLPVPKHRVKTNKLTQLTHLYQMEKQAFLLRSKMPDISLEAIEPYFLAYYLAGLNSQGMPLPSTHQGFALMDELKSQCAQEGLTHEFDRLSDRESIKALHTIYRQDSDLPTLLDSQLRTHTATGWLNFATSAMHRRVTDSSGNIDPRDRLTSEDFALLARPAINGSYNDTQNHHLLAHQLLEEDAERFESAVLTTPMKEYLDNLNTSEMAENISQSCQTMDQINDYLAKHTDLSRAYEFIKHHESRTDWRWDSSVLLDSELVGARLSRHYQKLIEIHRTIHQAVRQILKTSG